MKLRFAALFLATAALVILCSCGGEKTDAGKTDTGETAAEPSADGKMPDTDEDDSESDAEDLKVSASEITEIESMLAKGSPFLPEELWKRMEKMVSEFKALPEPEAGTDVEAVKVAALKRAGFAGTEDARAASRRAGTIRELIAYIKGHTSATTMYREMRIPQHAEVARQFKESIKKCLQENPVTRTDLELYNKYCESCEDAAAIGDNL